MSVLSNLPPAALAALFAISLIAFLLSRKIAKSETTINVGSNNGGVIVGGDSEGDISIENNFKNRATDTAASNTSSTVWKQVLNIVALLSGLAAIASLVLQTLQTN